ncbi:MAG: aspartate aminotransferase family protein [Chloroflexi bacterium]|nr:aspartate aminotransferase family protein [Chloroflexota bacterium]
MSQWTDVEKQYYMQCARRQPVVIVRGQGTKVWDEDGKEYLDFVAGWAVNNLGHCHPEVVKAIQEQAATLMVASNQFYTVPQLKLAKLLVEQSGLSRVFFCNSGAEAIEGAIKLARKFGKSALNGAYEIITLQNAFHGRTLTAITATGNPHYSDPFTPLTPGFVQVPANDLEAVKRASNGKTCAVLLEPVQGEGGVRAMSREYLQGLRAWCDQKNVLLVFDEVQTGMGRLGTLFGFQYFGVKPDILALAKGLGGGVAIGAFLCNQKADVFQPGDHGTTFGGNPLATAAAYAATRVLIEQKVPDHARRMGQRLSQALEQVKARHETAVREVRGVGLLMAVELYQDIAGDVVGACNQEGVLLNAVRPNTVRFMPPLTLTAAEADEGAARFERGLTKVLQAKG